MTDKAPVRLGDRDIQLLGLLAEARCLTQVQLQRLLWVGRNVGTATDRLVALAQEAGGGPWLTRHLFADIDSYHGRSAVWSLAKAGADLVERQTGVPPPVGVDLVPASLKHHLLLSELYVALLATPLERRVRELSRGPSRAGRSRALAGIYARAEHPTWRWQVLGSMLGLEWREYQMRDNTTRDRLIRPDAMLELIAGRGRVFIEAETGSQPVASSQADRVGATLAKVGRYLAYVTGMADVKSGVRWYQQRFTDGFVPEVLFLVATQGRADSIRAALGEARLAERLQKARLTVRALTLSEAVVQYLPRLGLDAAPVGAAPTAPVAGLSPSALTALIAFGRAYRAELQRQTDEARRAGHAPPQPLREWPAAQEAFRVLYDAQPRGGGVA